MSGTFKAYQFVDADWAVDSGVECDGIVLQNTVWSPNHGYVACDVEASRGTVGSRPPNDRGLDLYYPDNFNLYDEVFDGTDGPTALPAVTFEYGPGTGEDPPSTVAGLTALLAADRVEKLAGRRGTVLHDVDEFGVVPQDRPARRPQRARRLPGHRARPPGGERVLRRPARSGAARAPADARGGPGRAERDGHERRRPDGAPRAGPGCGFSDGVTTPMDAPTADSLRLHRVLTDDLEIVAPDGGDFSYRIVLP